MRSKVLITVLFIAVLGIASCKKEAKTVYQVQEQELYQSSTQKTNTKTTTQFITIAYNDLFNAAIRTDDLNKMNVALQAFGDKNIVQDMIVKSLLNKQGALIPGDNVMRSDVPTFVQQTYLRFYNRKPNEFEAWKLQNLIETNTDITPQMVYYSIMTSDEYKYY